jgi:hypothetical protein
VHGDEVVVFFIFLVIAAGVGLMIAAMFNRRRFRELEHRERLAMIERGLIPPPERNPAAFESAAGLKSHPEPAASGYRTAGVMMIGIGLGLMMLIAFAAGEPAVGFGVGGGFATLGAASLLNYSLISRRDEDRDLRWAPPPVHHDSIKPPNTP